MNIRPCNIRVLLMVLFVSGCVLVSQPPLVGQEKDTPKERNSIAALFDGIPADLRAKVRDNPVRIDRANDWVQENVTGKLKPIEIKMPVNGIYLPARSQDGTYTVRLTLDYAKVNVLGDEWEVFLNSVIPAPAGRFIFVGVSVADAEKLVEAKIVNIQGRVKYAKIVGGSGSSGGIAGKFAPPKIGFTLEDVQVEGKSWTPSAGDVGGPFGGPFGGGVKKGDEPPAKNKKGKKGTDM